MIVIIYDYQFSIKEGDKWINRFLTLDIGRIWKRLNGQLWRPMGYPVQIHLDGSIRNRSRHLELPINVIGIE